jgi:YidC/Oxa1 family membrane protein insertase
MAKLTPKIALIKAKYKGCNTQAAMQKQQQEIMELQQKEGYSPLSGCLPLLLQLPIIIFLYNVIRNPLSYIGKFSNDVVVSVHKVVNGLAEAAEFASIDQIKLVSQVNDYAVKYGTDGLVSMGFDLTKIPNFTIFGIDLAQTPSITNISWLVIIPVLAAASSWFSMWITRKLNNTGFQSAQDAQAQASMKMMDIMMPAMTLFMAFSFSGMLGLYWVFQSILSVLQTLVISRVMPMPKYTEEQLKEMRKAEKAAEKAQKEALKHQPKFKSLHYIDDDDYDELPDVKKNEQPKKKPGGIDVPDIKD